MHPEQRRVIGWAAYALAAILAAIYFLRPFWEWATWDRSKGTLDLGFVQLTSRPPFPSDARSVVVGVVLPIALAVAGFLVQGRRESEE